MVDRVEPGGPHRRFAEYFGGVDTTAFMAQVHAHPLVAGTELRLGRAQGALVQRFLDFYEERGLTANGDAPPLRDCCKWGHDCWRSCDDPDESGYGVSVPWVGPDYRPSGVLVLAINSNGAGDLAEAFAQAHFEQDELANGSKLMTYNAPGYRGNNIVWVSLRAASMLFDVLDGSEVRDRAASPAELVPALKRLVRIQTIKCSPPTHSSKPWREMWKNCPPWLLAHEIGLVRPRFIVAFGVGVRDALEQFPGFHPAPSQRERLHTGVLPVGSVQVEVFMLDHPRNGGYVQGLASLANLLLAR